MTIAGPLGTITGINQTAPLDANGRLVFDRLVRTDLTAGEATRARDAWAVKALTASTAARELATAWTGRRAALARRLRSLGWEVTEISISVERASPMIVGHSGAGTAGETSLALHPVSGQPWLAGSGLKGAARAVHDDDDGGGSIRTVFGDGSGSADGGTVGGVRILDAVAGADVAVGEVVMTPHSSDYYADPSAHAPGRWENPVPVPFLAVVRGTFHTMAVGRNRPEVETFVSDLKVAASWSGFGAKTAAGFGYATVSDEPTSTDASSGG